MIPGRSGTVPALGLALCVLLLTTGSASAATMVLQGRFACNDGGSLAGARVELLQIYTRRLPEIPPNVRVAVATHADANGGWGFRVSGGESNWRVRAVLVDADVGVKDFGIPWHHYADTLRTQNDRPLADYGTQVVPGAECRLWRAFKAAADGFRADTGGGHPGGAVTVLENAPTSGVPFSPYTDVFWPAGYSPTKVVDGATKSVAQHEYAHTVRHALDGNEAHFFFDSGRFWYLRSHSGSACTPTNHGFAFNEGWAEFWADEVRATPCPNATDFSIERNVAFELKRLVRTCQGVDRGRMVAVLAQNRGRIHSMSDFSNALGCVPRPVKRLGKVRRPITALLTLARLRAKAGRAFVASAGRTVAGARAALSSAAGLAEGARPRPARPGARAAQDLLVPGQPLGPAPDRAEERPRPGEAHLQPAARLHPQAAGDRRAHAQAGHDHLPQAGRRRGGRPAGPGSRGGRARGPRGPPGGRDPASRSAPERPVAGRHRRHRRGRGLAPGPARAGSSPSRARRGRRARHRRPRTWTWSSRGSTATTRRPRTSATSSRTSATPGAPMRRPA